MISVEGAPVRGHWGAVTRALQLVCVADHVHIQAQDHGRDQPHHDTRVGEHAFSLPLVRLYEHEMSSSRVASSFPKLLRFQTSRPHCLFHGIKTNHAWNTQTALSVLLRSGPKY